MNIKTSLPVLICVCLSLALSVNGYGNNGDTPNLEASNSKAPKFKNQESAMQEIGRQITSQLQSNSIHTIFVRHFRGPGTNELQLTNLLIEQLDGQFEIGPGGVEIEGRVRPMQGSGDGPPAGYRISVNLEGPDDTVAFPGASVDVENDMEAHIKLSETDATRPQPPEIAGQPFEEVTTLKPAVGELIKGTRIYAHPSSPYSMEILVKNEHGEFQPRKPFVENGALVINLERGETYKVRVYNDSGYESFAKLNIDGLGRFALSQNPRQRRNIDLVKTNSSRDFVGYFLTAQRAASFVVGEYEESVAKRVLGDAPDIGTISVAFGCTYTGAIPEHEKETKTVYRQETTTVMVPQVVTVPRTITETVPVPNTGPVPVQGGRQYKTRGNAGNSGGTRMETRQRTVYEQKTIMVPQKKVRTIQESRVVGTTEGPAVGDNVRTVSRKFGLTRAVIKLRYFATR